MKKFGKKSISLLLSLIMILSLFAIVPLTGASALDAPAEGYKRVFLDNKANWSSIKIHYWGGTNATSWPGNDVTDTVTYDDITYYYCDIPSDMTSIIFHNGNGNQTNDINQDVTDGTVWRNDYQDCNYSRRTSHTVTWVNGNDTLETDTYVFYGLSPVYDGETPTKESTDEYDYTFAGWSDGENTYTSAELPEVTGDVTYTATFDATAKPKPWTYNITTGGEYTCPSSLSQYTTVSGGTEENPVVINITGQTSGYPIQLKSGYLKIVGNNNTFSCDRGFVFFSESATNKPNGEAHLTVTDLTIISNSANNQYIQIISQNYKCQSSFENVTFKNCNVNGSGAVVIGNETTHTFKNCTFEDNTGYNAGGISIRYGSDVTMEGCTFKNCTRTRSYSTSFLGGGAVWLESDTKLTLDGCTFENCTGVCGAVGIVSTATLTLKGDTTITGNANGNLYLPTGATFKISEDFTGTVGVTTQTAPTDSASVTLASDLVDTQAALANNNIVSDNENYGVIYKDNSLLLINSKVYTVTWQDWDDTLLKAEVLAEGTTPTYDGTTPEKAEDANYTYTFAGWSPEITAVTGDVTYTAQYTATFKGITSDELYEGLVIDAGTPIKFLMMSINQIYQGIELEVYLDDVQVKSLEVNPGSTTEPDRYYTTTKKCIVDSYTLQHGQTTIHTLFLKSLNTVTWKDWDGEIIEVDEDVAYGTVPSFDGEEPTKAEDEYCRYSFTGWSPEVSAVTGDVTYTAQLNSDKKFVLFGWIEGGNYACEENSADTGEYYFDADGKCTAVFTQDAYVAVKSADNSEWYMVPASFYNADATSLDLYSTSDSNNKEKLHVPGNKRVTFTLTAKDGGFNLSYEAPLTLGHSLSLDDGDIGVNFFFNFFYLTDEQLENVKVDFAWNVEGKTKEAKGVNGTLTPNGCRFTCRVAAAEMTYDITATVKVGGEEIGTNIYSVKRYADKILSDDYKDKYVGDDYDELAGLVKAMLDYGARAQIKWGRNINDLANGGTYFNTEAVDPASITAYKSDMNAGLDAYGLEYAGSTISLESKTVIRHYYKLTDESQYNKYRDGSYFEEAGVTLTFGGEEATVNGKKPEIFFETEVNAAGLNDPVTLVIGENSYNYSALDYVKNYLNKAEQNEDTAKLVSSLYYYSVAADAYFG